MAQPGIRICTTAPVAPPPLSITVTDIAHLPSNHFTGPGFGNIIIQTLRLKDGSMYDVLFDAGGEPIAPGQHRESVARLASFFDKNLQPATLDGMDILINLINNKSS